MKNIFDIHMFLYKILWILLKTPFINKIILPLYIRMSFYQRKRNPFIKFKQCRTLIIYEPRFKYIIDELINRSIDFTILPRGIFDYLFKVNLSEYKKNSEYFQEFALDKYEPYKNERAAYLDDCTFFIKLLKKHFNTSTIILPKYNDDFTLELIQAFHNTDWNTIIYDREGTVTKKRLKDVPIIVSKMAPICNYVVVYNKMHKRFFERVFFLSKIPDPEIIIMGNPAPDEWFQNGKLIKPGNRSSQSRGKKITFFAFGEFSYIYDSIYLKEKNEIWRSLLTEIHDALADYLSSHPDDELFYKRGPKGNRDYWSGSEELLELTNARLIPSLANSNLLIVDSDFILAFQTTTIIDAMHTNKIIIYCAWGKNYDELKSGLIDFEKYAEMDAILHAHSAKELKKLLELDPKEVRVNMDARKNIRELYTTNPDGKVSKRFVDWLEPIL